MGKKPKAPRALLREEKQVMSRQLLESWYMLFWSLWTRQPKGTPREVHVLFGTVAAVHFRRLVQFYFPSWEPKSTEVHAGSFVPTWPRRPRIREAQEVFDYASQFILHMTETLIDHPDRIPVPPGGDWIAALAPFHMDWLRLVDPDDLDVRWKDNMVGFSVLTDPLPIEDDGGSHVQQNALKLFFHNTAGDSVADPPAFIRIIKERSGSLVWIPGDP